MRGHARASGSRGLPRPCAPPALPGESLARRWPRLLVRLFARGAAESRRRPRGRFSTSSAGTTRQRGAPSSGSPAPPHVSGARACRPRPARGSAASGSPPTPCARRARGRSPRRRAPCSPDRRPRLFEAGARPLTPGRRSASPRRRGEPADAAGACARRLASVAPRRAGRLDRRRARSGGTRSRGARSTRRGSPWPRASRSSRCRARCPRRTAPDEWRRAVWVPCGTLAGSVRFYEWFARGGRGGAARRARARSRSPRLSRLRARSPRTRPATLRCRSGRASSRRARGGEAAACRSRGRSRRRASSVSSRRDVGAPRSRRPSAGSRARPGRRAPRPGSRSRRVWRADGGAASPPWLDAIEAEREIAGGRPPEAKARLERIARDARVATRSERRGAAARGRGRRHDRRGRREAARRAAAWRRQHPDAPAAEIGAGAASRRGRALAGGPQRTARSRCSTRRTAPDASAPRRDGVETALVRAHVLALAGRFEEEAAVYDAVRPAALGAGDDRLAARFLSQEARGLLDRREYARAIVRLEEAIGVGRGRSGGARGPRARSRGDAVPRRASPARSEDALGGALAAAAAAGREDLARIARGNRVELLVNRCALGRRGRRDRGARAGAPARTGTTTRLLVALHHRSRLALRRGDLADGRARQRRGPPARRGDRGPARDRRALARGGRPPCSTRATARARGAAWERAARGSARSVRRDAHRPRAARPSSSWRAAGRAARRGLAALEALFARDPYRAAEAVARWRGLFGEAADPARAAGARGHGPARRRRRGARRAGLRIARRAEVPERRAARAARRGRRACARRGAESTPRALGALGLSRLAVRDAEGRELVGLGAPAAGGERRPGSALEAGAARFALALWPAPPAEIASRPSRCFSRRCSIARGARGDAPRTSSDGWRRLGIVTDDAVDGGAVPPAALASRRSR